MNLGGILLLLAVVLAFQAFALIRLDQLSRAFAGWLANRYQTDVVITRSGWWKTRPGGPGTAEPSVRRWQVAFFGLLFAVPAVVALVLIVVWLRQGGIL